MSDINGSGESEALRRLDRMNDVIQNMITLVHEEAKENLAVHQEFRKRHLENMEEIRGLMDLQKEQRIDIMALFTANKDLREVFKQYFEKHP